MNKQTIPVIVIILIIVVIVVAMGLNLTSDKKNNKEYSPDVKYSTAYFSGGCFWCIEAPLQEFDGVVEVISGYIGGASEDASYKKVVSGNTGHRESVKVIYDPRQVSFEELLSIFWMQIDPQDDGGQFADRGLQYTTALYYSSDDEKHIIELSKEELKATGKFDTIVTQALKFSDFFAAEEYHQDFYLKSSDYYKKYKEGSGRGYFITDNWAKELALLESEITSWDDFLLPSDKELKDSLTAMQYKVTQNEWTEPAFNNEYYNNKKVGIYVDIVSGEPLFSSTDKYDSKTGWPSFTKAIYNSAITEHNDNTYGTSRIEVRSKVANSHLGHLFNDGPKAAGGFRYCINSASLRFIAKEELAGTEYEEYLKLFE